MNNICCVILIIGLAITFSSCGNRGNDIDLADIENEIGLLPEDVVYPMDNLYTVEKEELGKLLFWDPIISGGKDVSCATCHHPQFGYADGRALSIGIDGVGLGPDRRGGNLIKRNSPTIINTAFNGIVNGTSYIPERAPMFWDNRASSLEEQSIMPMLDKDEMRGVFISEEAILDTIINRLEVIEEYKGLFKLAFGTSEITEERIAQSIATFERSLLSNNSRFDQYLKGDVDALSNDELEGLERFIQVGCADCHSGSMLSDFDLHTLGVPGNGLFIDEGATGAFDFRTPTLRNIALTSPYMHNGVFNTLEEVVDFYEDLSDGRQNAINDEINLNQVDDEARNLRLNGGAVDEIVAFLNTLTDESFDQSIPDEVPSKLAVGGDIE